jgi:hypothetical protein
MNSATGDHANRGIPEDPNEHHRQVHRVAVKQEPCQPESGRISQILPADCARLRNPAVLDARESVAEVWQRLDRSVALNSRTSPTNA